MAGIFVLVAILLLVAAAVVVLPTFLLPHRLKNKGQYGKERADNIRAGRERMRALTAAVEAGELSQQEADEYALEIENTLLQDLEGASASPDDDERQLRPDWPMGAIVVLSLLLLTPLLYVAVGTPSGIFVSAAVADSGAGTGTAEVIEHPGGDVDMDAFVQKLEAKLADDPRDLQALLWMGRIHMASGIPAEAADYFTRALEVEKHTADIYAWSVDALMLDDAAGNRALIGRLLAEGLRLEPSHSILLWLSGIHAERQGDLAGAIAHWEKARATVSDSPRNQRQLSELIAEANRRLAAGGALPASATDAAGTDSADTQVAAADGGVTVVVEAGADAANASGVLFVFARVAGENAPPVPLAVHRQANPAFPLQVVLDDSLAMMPQMKMSGFPQYRIVARLSGSGNAKPASGDVFGELDGVSPGAHITIRLDKVVP